MGFRDLFSGLGSKSKKETGLNGLIFTWISKLEKDAQPPKEIIALNFGLFESDKGFIIYLTGSEKYDSSNDDWAAEIDYEPVANLKYLLLTGEDVRNLQWDALLKIVIESLKELFKKHSEYLLFKDRIVTSGFDDGDLTVIKP